MVPPQLLRARLLDPLCSGRFGIVEAGGGYGKSVLGEQLSGRLGVPTARLALRPRDAEPALFPITLLQSLRAARLSDLATALEGRAEVSAAVDALVEALAATAEEVLIVVDDAHYLEGPAVTALAQLFAVLPAPHRLVMLGRSTPPLAPGGGHAEHATRLSRDDLSFRPEEIERYLFETGALHISDFAVATIRRATGGWPAAVALWAKALASADDAEATVETLAAQRAGLGSLVEALLGDLNGEELAMTYQVAHLPLLSPQATAEITGMPHLYARIEEAGLPLVEARPGWARIADPVAEHLTGKRPLAKATAVRAGEVYEKYREDAAAISTLLAGGLDAEAAAVSARRAGDDRWTAGVLLRLAEDALRELCQYAEAIAAIEEALQLLAGTARGRALALSSRCDTLLEIGRVDEAEAGVAESMHLGRIMHDSAVIAYAAWTEIELATVLGDRARLISAIERCEQHRQDWFSGFSGLGFLTDAADALDRLGLHDRAAGYLERARSRRHQDERQFAIAEACIAARSGDPVQGRLLIRDALGHPGLSPRRRWRLQLLDAWAASASGDKRAGRLAAGVFDSCLDLGWPQLPLVRERTVAEELLPLAAASGSYSARSLSEKSGRMRLRCLGEFVLTRRGRVLELPPGRPTAAVMAVVAAKGSLHAEQLIDLLWPDADLDTGRGRLRNVMSRVKAVADDLLQRQGDIVRLGPEVEVDITEFEAGARQALALEPTDPDRAAAVARDAAALYRGPALSDARYESWAVSARERAHSLYLRLLDLLARDAERHEQVDQAVRLLEQAIEVEPYDEDRYAKAATLLRSQGRVGSARTMLQRCRSALEELGMEPTLSAWDGWAEEH